MARINGPRKVYRYSAEFKLKAVKLSDLAGVQVKDVAEALDIHPFMLSRRRKEARDGQPWVPALAIGCAGLWRLIRLHHGSVAAGAAAGLNALGGALFTAMVVVQMAIGVANRDRPKRALQAIWLGLDVAWDPYIGLGTVLFGFSMLRHPQFGRVFAASGVAVGFALLLFNLYTFPTPPANAGLVDLGPVIGLWYLAVTVQMWRSLR